MIAGLGMTGLSYARFLSQAGHDFIVMDDAPQPDRVQALLQLNPQAEVMPFDAPLMLAAEEILVSPGLPLKRLQSARDAGVPLRGDVGIFGEFLLEQPAEVVAITGTNGKSTVTELLYHFACAQLAEVRLAGNIGVPCLDALDDAAQLYVLEVSSYQLELAPSLNSAAAVLLNLAPDHLDRYESLDAYYQTKLSIYNHCQRPVINRDLGLALAAPYGTFGSSPPPGADDFGLRREADADLLMQGSQTLLTGKELPLPGRHNQLNVLAALALGRAIDLDLDGMLSSLRDFKGLPHRSEWVAELDGVAFINDSKATNPTATLASVLGHASGKNIMLILGGELKGTSFQPLATALAPHVKQALLIGAARVVLAESLEGVIAHRLCDTLEEAVQTARSSAVPGDLILLAPGCASFDSFADYRARGEHFKQLVKELLP